MLVFNILWFEEYFMVFLFRPPLVVMRAVLKVRNPHGKYSRSQKVGTSYP